MLKTIECYSHLHLYVYFVYCCRILRAKTTAWERKCNVGVIYSMSLLLLILYLMDTESRICVYLGHNLFVIVSKLVLCCGFNVLNNVYSHHKSKIVEGIMWHCQQSLCSILLLFAYHVICQHSEIFLVS